MVESTHQASADVDNRPDQGPTPVAAEIFSFVVTEIIRFQRELNENGIRNIDLYDALSMLRGDSGRQRIIGRQALSELNRLAKYEISRTEKLKGHVETEKLAQEIQRALIDELDQPTKYSPDEVVSTCVERVVRSISSSRNYFYPCVMPIHSMISRFRIGPVVFHRKSAFQNYIKTKCKDDDLAMSYIHQNERFNWIADVELSGFSFAKGGERSALFARLAIAGIKLCFKERFAKWLGTIDQTWPLLLKYNAHETSGRVYIGYSKQFILNARDDDMQPIFTHDHSIWMKKIGSFLEQYISRSDFGFIGTRIISALTWIDTGCTPSPAAQRIVAYSNALEVLFVTDDRNVSHQIRTRAAPLLSVFNKHTEWERNIRDFYKVRSELIHGALPPMSETLERHVVSGADLTGKATIAMIEFCGWLLQRYPADKTPRDLSPFDGPRSLARAFEAHLAEFVAESSGR